MSFADRISRDRASVALRARRGPPATTLKSLANRLMRRGRRGLVDRTPSWAHRFFGPAARYFDMLLFDHGLVRLIYLNKHRIGERAWRAAQPAPHDIRALARQGVRTIINLRGPRLCGSYHLERAACERHGIALIDLPIRSRAAPTRQSLIEARELFESVEHPILIHCKSGADRAGFMSVFYRHVMEGVPVAEALGELSLRYGHFRQADTGILDRFYERYLEDNERRPIAFLDWVERVYDPEDLVRSFRAKRWANGLVNKLLRRE